MFPSIETIGLGFAITAALALIDWYVWRTAPTLPYPLPSRGCRLLTIAVRVPLPSTMLPLPIFKRLPSGSCTLY